MNAETTTYFAVDEECAKPSRRADVVCEPAGAETLLYDPLADAIHVLNSTALAVWELCDGQHAAAGIEAHLRAHYAGTSGRDVAADVQAVLAVLRREGLFVDSGPDKVAGGYPASS